MIDPADPAQVLKLCTDSGFLRDVPQNVYYMMYSVIGLVIIMILLLLSQAQVRNRIGKIFVDFFLNHTLEDQKNKK